MRHKQPVLEFVWVLFVKVVGDFPNLRDRNAWDASPAKSGDAEERKSQFPKGCEILVPGDIKFCLYVVSKVEEQ